MFWVGIRRLRSCRSFLPNHVKNLWSILTASGLNLPEESTTHAQWIPKHVFFLGDHFVIWKLRGWKIATRPSPGSGSRQLASRGLLLHTTREEKSEHPPRMSLTIYSLGISSRHTTSVPKADPGFICVPVGPATGHIHIWKLRSRPSGQRSPRTLEENSREQPNHQGISQRFEKTKAIQNTHFERKTSLGKSTSSNVIRVPGNVSCHIWSHWVPDCTGPHEGLVVQKPPLLTHGCSSGIECLPEKESVEDILKRTLCMHIHTFTYICGNHSLVNFLTQSQRLYSWDV